MKDIVFCYISGLPLALVLSALHGNSTKIALLYTIIWPIVFVVALIKMFWEIYKDFKTGYYK